MPCSAPRPLTWRMDLVERMRANPAELDAYVTDARARRAVRSADAESIL